MLGASRTRLSVKASSETNASSCPVVLVTGCSSGLGYALAKEFVAQKCTVYATARRVESIDSLKALGCKTLALDVTKNESIDTAVNKVMAAEGRISVLINNAGVGAMSPALEADLAGMRALYDTNVFGALAVTQAVARHMVAARSGRIVNMGSIAGWSAFPYTAAYSSSKAALQSISQALRVELRPFGVQVMHLTPGFVRSEIMEKAGEALEYKGELYRHPAVQKGMEMFTQGTVQPSAMNTEEFARRVVAAVLAPGRMPRTMALGANVIVQYLCTYVLPLWLVEEVWYYVTGLAALAHSLPAQVGAGRSTDSKTK